MRNTKLFTLAIILLAICACAYYFSSIFTLFGIAGLLAFLLNPLARAFMRRFHIRKGLAIAIVFMIFLLFFSIILSTVVPWVVGQIRTFANKMPEYSKTFDVYYDKLLNEMNRVDIPKGYIDTLDDYTNKFVNFLTNTLLSLISLMLTRTTKILDVLIVITLAVYFMLDTRMIVTWISILLPEKTGKRFLLLVNECYEMLWKYLKYKTLISAGMALTTFIVFTIVGVDYAMLLALVAFFLDYIPYFGSIIAGVIAALVAFLTSGLTQAIIIAVCVLVIQQIEGNVVNPKIQGDSVGLHPIVVMFSVLACNQLWGPLGMFIAVPLGGLIKIVLREVYRFMMDTDVLPAQFAQKHIEKTENNS